MAYDFFSQLNQSVADKVINSVSYPITVFEKRQNFPGCSRLAAVAMESDSAGFYIYSNSEIETMFRSSTSNIVGGVPLAANSIDNEILSFGGSILGQTKKALDASSVENYAGPKVADLKKIIDDGIAELPRNLNNIFGDFEIYGWCPYLKVVIREKPQVDLNSPRLDLSGVRVNVTATGELWAKFPWLECHKWCTQWVKVSKCEKIASVTISLDIAAAAHADFQAAGALVKVRAEFDRLRLEYPILEKIPLEGLANRALGDSMVTVFNASELVASVPIVNSKFGIASIDLPNTQGGVSIGVNIRQL